MLEICACSLNTRNALFWFQRYMKTPSMALPCQNADMSKAAQERKHTEKRGLFFFSMFFFLLVVIKDAIKLYLLDLSEKPVTKGLSRQHTDSLRKLKCVERHLVRTGAGKSSLIFDYHCKNVRASLWFFFWWDLIQEKATRKILLLNCATALPTLFCGSGRTPETAARIVRIFILFMKGVNILHKKEKQQIHPRQPKKTVKKRAIKLAVNLLCDKENQTITERRYTNFITSSKWRL